MDLNGGYDDGYAASKCFWGTEPSSLVRQFLRENDVESLNVLDLGCGEGKNANAFAIAGANVEAVDCSALAIENGRAIFTSRRIRWHIADVATWPLGTESHDIVILYGLFHCLASSNSIAEMVQRSRAATKVGGHHIVCTFNDRSHDLRAHPGFRPLLLPHEWFLRQYADWHLLSASDSDLYETHPHNMIPHHHSLTRLIARKDV